MKRLIKALLPLALCMPLASHAQDTLKIGALVTLSGPGAAWGQAMLYGAQFAADDVNAKGGLDVGGTHYQIKIIPYDDKYQTADAVTAANRLINDDQVKYIIGPMGSAPTLAVQPLTEQNQILTLVLGFTAKALQPQKTYSFRPNLTTEETSYPAIQWMVNHYHLKKVGAMFPNDETGQQMSGDLARAYTKAGASLSSQETFERGRVDMVPLLTRMMASGIDAIDLNGDPPDMAGLIVKQARELGFKGPIVRNGGPGTPQIVAVAGKEADGIIVLSLFDPANKAIAAYAQRYQTKYKTEMNGFSPSFFDGTNMLFQAMQTAGTVTDTAKVRDALAAIKNYPGIQGTLNWTGQEKYGINHQIDSPFFLSRITNGREVAIAVCSFRSCEDIKQ